MYVGKMKDAAMRCKSMPINEKAFGSRMSSSSSGNRYSSGNRNRGGSSNSYGSSSNYGSNSNNYGSSNNYQGGNLKSSGIPNSPMSLQGIDWSSLLVSSSNLIPFQFT